MPNRNHDRRDDVLDAAKAGAWTIDTARTPHGAISDQFTRGSQTLTCFWSQTPWSDARWSNGVLAGPDEPRQVWRIEGADGVLAVLRSDLAAGASGGW